MNNITAEKFVAVNPMTTATANIFVVAHSVAIVTPHRLDLCGASAVRTLYHFYVLSFLLITY